jgi:hypothetical protein
MLWHQKSYSFFSWIVNVLHSTIYELKRWWYINSNQQWYNGRKKVWRIKISLIKSINFYCIFYSTLRYFKVEEIILARDPLSAYRYEYTEENRFLSNLKHLPIQKRIRPWIRGPGGFPKSGSRQLGKDPNPRLQNYQIINLFIAEKCCE